MRERRAQVLHDVDVEVAEGRVHWNYNDVYDLIAPHPQRGKRFDAQPEDEGRERDSNGSEEDDDDDEGGGGDDGNVKNVHEHTTNTSTVVETTTTDPTTSTASGQDVVVEDTESALLLNDLCTKIDSMSIVLQQVQALEDVVLEAQIKKAITNIEKRGRTLALVHPDVANAFLRDQDESRIRELRNRLSVQKAVHEDAQQKLTIKELVRQQERLSNRKRRATQSIHVGGMSGSVEKLGNNRPWAGPPNWRHSRALPK
jgi:hypothetical protein